MAAPNLINATSIYGKNATATGNGSEQTVLTCATDKLIKITSKNDRLIFRILKAPGILLQNITTKQPDDKMIEVSIAALKDAFGDEYDNFVGKKYRAEAIG